MPKKTEVKWIDTGVVKGRAGGGGGYVLGQGSGSTGGGGSGGGVTDHAELTGLGSRTAHPQYLLTDVAAATYQPIGDYLLRDEAAALYVPLTRQVLAGLGLDGGGALSDDVTITLAPPTSLTATTVNAATDTGHTHDVVTRNNVENGLAGEHILSAINGQVVLTGATLRGGDMLIVAGDGSPMIQTERTYGGGKGSIGFGRVPDPQFMVDVAGPLRAEVLVGPHALQLKDVLFLAHYDAPIRDYHGEVNGHMGQLAKEYDGGVIEPKNIRFGRGKFNAAVAVSRASHNFMPDGKFDLNADLTGWVAWNPTGHVGGSYSIDHVKYHYGGGSLRLRAKNYAAGHNTYYHKDIVTHQTVANSVWTLSGWCYRESNTVDNAIVIINGQNATPLGKMTATKIGEWEFLSVTCPAQAGTGHNVGVGFEQIPSATTKPNASTWWDSVQLELSPIATPFNPTDVANGGYCLLYEATPNLDAFQGSVGFWFFCSGVPANGQFLWGGNLANAQLDIIIRGEAAAPINFRTKGATAAWNPPGAADFWDGKWHHIGATWDANTGRIALYVDGVLRQERTGYVRETTADGQFAIPAWMWVGSGPAAGLGISANGYFDDVFVTSSAMTDDEMIAVFESDAPVFAESSTFSFRAGADSVVWADDNGLWVRTAAQAVEVLGVYAGRAATYAWGGFTMEPGDFALGRLTGNNSLFWDNSTGKLTIHGDIYANAGTFTGTVTANAGSIGGWTINTTGLTHGNVGMLSAGNYAFYAGNAAPASAPFSVTIAGAIVAKSGIIGGFTLSADKLASSAFGVGGGLSSKPGTNAANSIVIYAGVPATGAPENAPFRVNAGGLLHVQGEIETAGGFRIRDINSAETLPGNDNAIFSVPVDVNGGAVMRGRQLVLGKYAGAVNTEILLGFGRLGDGVSQLLLYANHLSATSPSASLQRFAGANGVLALTNTGSGGVQLHAGAVNGTFVDIYTGGSTGAEVKQVHISAGEVRVTPQTIFEHGITGLGGITITGATIFNNAPQFDGAGPTWNGLYPGFILKRVVPGTNVGTPAADHCRIYLKSDSDPSAGAKAALCIKYSDGIEQVIIRKL